MSEHQNVLKEIYETAANRPNGYTWSYNEYTFEKVDLGGPISSPRHSEVNVYNSAGNKVECFSVAVFDDWEAFAERFFEVVECDPDDLYDWLNREK